MKKLLIGVAVAVAVIATSAGTTVATARYAPQLLPQGPQGEQGLVGQRGPSGAPGKDGTDGADGLAGDENVTYEENSDDDTDECSSYAGGTGVCTEGPEYEEMCRQIWEDMQDGKIETGGYTDEGSEAVDRYSRNSCDQR